MNRIWATTAVALLALTGCAAAPSSEKPTSAATSGTTTVESMCKDDAANGSMGVGLKQARLHSDDSELFVEYTLADALPARESFTYSSWPEAPTAIPTTCPARISRTGRVLPFRLQVDFSRPEDLTQGAEMTGSTITVRYPLAELEGLGEGFGAPRGAVLPSGGGRPSPLCCRSSMKKLGAV